ncbi:MAG: CDP-alcohol phosphatidyltransferase family protein [Promethearchaeota archaeon]
MFLYLANDLNKIRFKLLIILQLEEKMSTILSLLKLKDYITLIGSTLGIISLICAGIGTRSAISLGFFLISISLGTDLIDGYIARKTGTVNEIGRELDSLSDSLTFGISPAILIYQAFKTGNPYDFVLIIGCILFALGAILRLARFNISDSLGYTGIPTPLSALLMIAYFYGNYFYAFAYGGASHYAFPELTYYFIPLFLALTGWFNITTHISFGEKSRLTYTIIICVAPLCPILGIIGILNPNFIISILVSIFFFSSFIGLFGYMILGFFLKRRYKK